MSDSIPARDLAILGGGAAGMMAAIAAAESGTRQIVLFEKNARPGIKVLVCGGGRCNFTNAGTLQFLIEQFGRNGRFLTPALRALDNEGLREFFANLGVPSHVEHDGKVYPDSNQAKSVVDALVRRMRELEVEVFAGADQAIASVMREENGFLLQTTGGTHWRAKTLILAVGGMSYQRMGTVGDGYRIAASLGHTIVKPRPAIVGLLIREEWAKSLRGLAIRDVELRIDSPGRTSKADTRRSTGDMLFTHFGLSGPAVLNPSEIIAELLERTPEVPLRIDFIRHESHDALHALLRRWQRQDGRKRVRTMLSQGQGAVTVIESTSPDMTFAPTPTTTTKNPGISIPVRLAKAICELEQISDEQICAELTSPQIHRLVERLKASPFTAYDTRGFKEAMVTAGGVKLSEVNPATMASKIVPGLFLVGEVLDLTGPSGGYNLQLAFSTGQLAGRAVGELMSS